MSTPRVHLIAPAASCRPFLAAIGAESAEAFIATVQETLGPGVLVTGDATLIEASENDSRGGRDDDARRAADIEAALGDDNVSAIVDIRGGAWFTRILPRIDFSVIDHRCKPIAVFGFSELTSLVNIVAAHERAVGIYDMGPAFLTYGLRRHASKRPTGEGESGSDSAGEWSQRELVPQFHAFLRDVRSMIEGRGTERRITARLIRGELPDHSLASFSGGNLTVVSALVGTAYQSCVVAADHWMVIEDLNEKPERIDRMLSHLTLSGCWQRCAGLLLGDFHRRERELTDVVVELLRYHLPSNRSMPILTTEHVGHVWPMSPLPLHLPLTMDRLAQNSFSIHWPASALRTI